MSLSHEKNSKLEGRNKGLNNILSEKLSNKHRSWGKSNIRTDFKITVLLNKFEAFVKINFHIFPVCLPLAIIIIFIWWTLRLDYRKWETEHASDNQRNECMNENSIYFETSKHCNFFKIRISIWKSFKAPMNLTLFRLKQTSYLFLLE